jgi:phospholipase C
MSSSSPIQHIFVVMLENHSFDNMLALSGIPGLIAAGPGNCNSWNGQTYRVAGSAPGSMPTDPGHEFPDVAEQLCGAGAQYPPGGPYPPIDNSGFAANYATSTTEGPAPPAADIGDIMLCFDTAQQLPVLYQLATEFVVCDQWFSSLPGPTWPNRYFLHGASSSGLDHSPTDKELLEWETVDGFRYPNGSIFDAMNARGVGYRLYHDDNGPLEGRVSQVSSLHGIELWDVNDLSGFANDLQGSYPWTYTFIEPNYGDVINGSYAGGSSQYPMDGVTRGEALLKEIYETLRSSPLWESSALIVLYDEHGGFYDHVAPGAAAPPGDGSSAAYNQSGFTFDRHGVRVPALIVSPWLAPGVDHTGYDHASVLATLESLFGLDPLTDRDRTAHPIGGLLAPVLSSRSLRTDCPTTLATPLPVGDAAPALYLAARELEPIPKGRSLTAFLGVLLKADSQMSGSPAARARFQSLGTRADARAYLHDVMGRALARRASRPRQERSSVLATGGWLPPAGCVRVGRIMSTTGPATPEEPHPEPHPPAPTRGISWIFFGPHGLRAGWSMLIFAAVLAALGLSINGIFAHVMHHHPHQGSGGPLPPSLGMLGEGIQLLLVFIATFVMSRIEHKSVLAYGYQGQARGVRFFSGLVWGFIALSALVLSLWKLGYLDLTGIDLHGASALRYAAEWGVMFLLVGLFEESIMRGYLQFAFTRGVGFWWGALVMSFLFGFGHGHNPGESPIGLVAAGAIGLVFCLSLWYTGSLWWAVGFHAAWDWAESYFYGTADSGLIVKGHFLGEHPAGPLLWSGGTTGPEGSVFILPLIAIMALLMLLWWGRRVRSPFAGAAWCPIRPSQPAPPSIVGTPTAPPSFTFE